MSMSSVAGTENGYPAWTSSSAKQIRSRKPRDGHGPLTHGVQLPTWETERVPLRRRAGGSILTFYALWETSAFAKHWLPFCKRYNIEPRSPAAYFAESDKPRNSRSLEEWSIVKVCMHISRTLLDVTPVASGKMPNKLMDAIMFLWAGPV
jgi:hypothetical protein